MFVLHPDGSSGGGMGGGPGGQGGLSQKLWFFGQLGIYFGLLHAVSYYLNPTEGTATIKDGK